MLSTIGQEAFLHAVIATVVCMFVWVCLTMIGRHLLLRPMLKAASDLEEWLPKAGRPQALGLRKQVARLAALRRIYTETLRVAEMAKLPSVPQVVGDEPEATLLDSVREALVTREAGLIAAGGDAAVSAWFALGGANMDLLRAAHGELQEAGFNDLLKSLMFEPSLHGLASHVATDAVDTAGRAVYEHGLELGVVKGEMIQHYVEAKAHALQAADHVTHSFGDVGVDDVHAHIPVFTIIVASVREATLLAEQKTTAERALVHVAIDAGAVAGGGFAGAKLGAMVGTLIVPGLGTAIGGALGGILGAVGGKIAATEVKMVPLREATDHYQKTAAAASAGQRESAATMVHAVRVASEDGTRQYQQSVGRLRKAVVSLDTSPQVHDVAGALEAHRGRAEVMTRAEQHLARLKAAWPSDSLVLRLLGLSVERRAQAIWADASTRAADAISRWTNRTPTSELDARLQMIVDEFWTSDDLDILTAQSSSLAAQIEGHARALKREAEAAEGQFRRSMKLILSVAEREATRHQAAGRVWLEKLKVAHAEVVRHKAALGLS